ncbi:MAG: 30S ribosomal protein S1 [Bryobacteraceae bacterium]
MPNPLTTDQDRPFDPESQPTPGQGASFGDILSQFEQSQTHAGGESTEGIEATVVSVGPESVIFDVGRKTEGVIPVADLRDEKGELTVKPGDKVQVSVTGRAPEGYYLLSRIRVERPKDWSGLKHAFEEKRVIGGTVTGAVKGGLSVDIGVRAFLPASRSGIRDLNELVGQEIRCKIIELDTGKEDVVVDRLAVLKEEEAEARNRRVAELQEGAVVHGTVRSLTDYGAFVDVGGIDGLLHVADLSWARVNKPADVLSVGQEIDVKVLKVDAAKRKISLGLKQLQPHPWELAAEKYTAGERVRGTVTRVTDFGAFVELEPGVEGLIHFSEMSWSKKARKPSDVVKPGDSVEVMILGVKAAERRISLGLKQALGDPWAEIEKKYPLGSTAEGKVVSLQKFGAFVELEEGVEGMIHVGDISAEGRINHPQDVLKMGAVVKAAVLEVDKGKRRLRLGMKQLVPTSLDEYIAEHKEGDTVTGRVADVGRGRVRVELGEGVYGQAAFSQDAGQAETEAAEERPDLSALTSMLEARWKGGAGRSGKGEPVQGGQIRAFRITKLDAAGKRIELEAL